MAEPFINSDMFILHLCSSEIVLFIDTHERKYTWGENTIENL